jgi:hypothetical protein
VKKRLGSFRWGALAVLGIGAVLGATVLSPVFAKSQKTASTKYVNKRINKKLKSTPNLQFVRSDKVTVGAGADGSAIATCPSGYYATGGGGVYPALTGVQVLQSNPSNGAVAAAGFTAWEYRIRNQGGQPREIRAYVVCAKTNKVVGNYTPGSSPF